MGSPDVHVEIDLGNLLIGTIVELKPTAESSEGEEWLRSLAENGAQMLINKMWELPSEYRENVVVAKLPEPTTKLPREKHIPKGKPPTRWEKFAKTKGIQKKKKDKLAFDEASKEWKPTWGYRSSKNEKPWLVEVPENADPNADYFAKTKEKKGERVAKNEFQRLRNIGEANKMKVRNMEGVDRAGKEEISRTVVSAKAATASMGKFMNKLPKEKPAKNMGKKRKFESNYATDMKSEKEKNLRIFEEIKKKRPKLDIQQAVQVHMLKKTGKNDSSSENRVNKKKKVKPHDKRNRNNKKGKKAAKKTGSFQKKGKSDFKKKK